MKKNTKRLTSILLAMALAAGASFSCIFTSAASTTSIVVSDDNNDGKMSIPEGSEPVVKLSTTVKDANTYGGTIEFGGLLFTYNFDYEGTEITGKWDDSYDDNNNNMIRVVNTSTTSVDVTVSYDSAVDRSDIDSTFDLGIVLSTSPYSSSGGKTEQDITLKNGASKAYYAHPTEDLAEQATNKNMKLKDLNKTKVSTGIIKVTMVANNTALN